jgi:hypothetical protein
MLSEWKEVKVRFTLLFGSRSDGGTMGKHLIAANDILSQCCLRIKPHYELMWGKAKTKTALGGDFAVDQYPNTAMEDVPLRTSEEEKKLTKQQPDGFAIYAYYVKRIDRRGEFHPRGYAYWYKSYSSPPAAAVLVADSAILDSVWPETKERRVDGRFA